jgi:hypothetical protein
MRHSSLDTSLKTFNPLETSSKFNLHELKQLKIEQKSPCVDEKVAKKSRPTVYEHEMSITETKINTGAIPKIIANRPTTFVQNELDITTSRRTIPTNDELDKTLQDDFGEKSTKASRPTVYEHEMSMSETKINTGAIPKVFSNRPTTFVQNEMDVTTAPVTSSRRTIITNESIGEECEKQIKIESRATIHQQGEMNFSGIDKLPNESIDNYEIDGLRDEILSPPSGFKFNQSRLTLFDENKTLVDESVRQSVIVQNQTMNINESLAAAVNLQRKTCHVPEAMELNDENDERRKTFVVKPKEDSCRWLNVTEADLIDNMIDDESSPCLVDEEEETFEQEQQQQRDSSGNISRYEDVLDDFINITIDATISNHTIASTAQSNNSSRRVSRPLSPVRDYENMLDNLMITLRKKNAPKPRLAIDEYLEKMKIEPVKIKLRKDHEPEAILERINAKKEEVRKRREERQKREEEINAAQYPQIPSMSFLIDNLLQW